MDVNKDFMAMSQYVVEYRMSSRETQREEDLRKYISSKNVIEICFSVRSNYSNVIGFYYTFIETFAFFFIFSIFNDSNMRHLVLQYTFVTSIDKG